MLIGPKLQGHQSITNIIFKQNLSESQSDQLDFFEGIGTSSSLNEQLVQQAQQQQQKQKSSSIEQEVNKIDQEETVKQPEIIVKPKTPEELLFEQYNPIIQEALTQFKNAVSTNAWEKCEDKKNIKSFKMNSGDGIVETLGESLLNEQQAQEFNILFEKINYDLNLAKVLSSMTKEQQVVKEINKDMRLLFTESSPPFGSNRFSKLVSATIQENETTYYIVSKCTFPSDVKVKDTSKLLESTVYFSGWSITKQSNSNEYKVVNAGKFLPGGSLPNFVMNKVRNNRGFEQLKLLREYLDKQIKQKSKK